jgi:hypothetical protein
VTSGNDDEAQVDAGDMDAEYRIAVTAAGIALIAMLVSLWQAREAMKARRASEDQAASSWRAAEAAESSAQADQAQMRLALRTQHDQEAPRFVIRWLPHTTHNGSTDGPVWERFEIKCLNSPRPIDWVEVSVQSRQWADLLRDENGMESLLLRFEHVASGLHFPVDVRLIQWPQAQVILKIESWRGDQNWLSYEYPHDIPNQYRWSDRPR